VVVVGDVVGVVVCVVVVGDVVGVVVVVGVLVTVEVGVVVGVVTSHLLNPPSPYDAAATSNKPVTSESVSAQLAFSV
jgi:hypothetical protein